ncbi:MAG: flagellin, partial [Clostridiales bacterium]
IRYEIGIGDNMNVNVLGGDIFNAGDESIGAKKSTITGTTDITLPITIDGTNDQFSITVDEDGSETVSIVNGTYETMEELVNVMQNGVDLYLGSGKIDITYQDEKLKLSSTTKGEESLVSVDPTSSAAASLGINVVTATDGEDGGTGSLIVCMNDLIEALDDGDNELVGEMLGVIDDEMNNILRVRADVGARQNRLELTSNRLENDNINFTRLMSLNEDVDMAETIMMLKNEENVYNASLSGGAKIIMPTLVDFLR